MNRALAAEVISGLPQRLKPVVIQDGSCTPEGVLHPIAYGPAAVRRNVCRPYVTRLRNLQLLAIMER